MKKLLIILLIFFVIDCSEKRDKSKQVFYFYSEIGQFEKYQTKDGISFSTTQYRIPFIDFAPGARKLDIYSLSYFNGDTTFRKKKSYLDSIRYYDYYWLTNDSNLQDFWTKKKYGSSRRKDTLEIYLIEKIANTDSVLFRRVQRKFSFPQPM